MGTYKYVSGLCVCVLMAAAAIKKLHINQAATAKPETGIKRVWKDVIVQGIRLLDTQ